MLKRVIIIITLAVGSTVLITGNAVALTIDFRDPFYSVLAEEKKGSFYSSKDELWLYALPSSSTDPPDRYLTWYADDGIGGGGSSYEEDEWELNNDYQIGDYLHIVFDESVMLTEIHLTDFFYEKRGDHWYEESGIVSFRDEKGNTLGGGEFSQTDTTVLPSPASNGEYAIDVASLIGAGTLAKEIILSGIGHRWVDGVREDHEFSVAGLNVNPVPEPATMLLLGSGLVGLAGFRRKFRKK
jgi:hypothetical protein